MTRAATQPRSLLQDLQRVCVVGLSVAALVHATLDVDVPLVVAIHSFTAWLYVLAWPLGVAAAVQRRWGRAAVCGVLVAAHLWWVMPRGGGRPDVRSGPTITLLSANLYAPNREPAALVGEIGSVDADVVVLQELTRRWRRELQPVVGGLHEHSVVRDDAFGIGVFSKHPLLASDTTTTWDLPALRVELQPPGGERLAIYVVHTLPPATRHGAQVRREQLERLREQLESERLPFVVLGDLNLTVHDPLWGHLVREPVVDAMGSCGRWWGPTWPNGVVPLPPLRLDHALHSDGLSCVAVSEGVGEGSDHRPVQVVLRR